VDLNERQRDTLDRLIGPADARPGFDPDLKARLQAIAEAEIEGETAPGGVSISKRLMSDLSKCEGFFAATLLREGPPFEHSEVSASGSLLHRAIKEDIAVGSADRIDGPDDVCRAALGKLLESDREFAGYWATIDADARARICDRAAALLARFREVFPPLRQMRSELQPAAEAPYRADLNEDNVTLRGIVDLAIGRVEPNVASRLLIDHKTGNARPEFAEEMRFYALILALSKPGAPPYRIASYFVESGEWQAEDVDGRILEHTAKRVGRAARLAIDIVNETARLTLTPGPYCSWCPRARTCPSSAA
jgi:hypothetical protein